MLQENKNGTRACNAMQRLQPLLLTNLRLLQVEGVSGIQQSGGRRAAGEVAMVRVLQLPAQPNKTKQKMMLPFDDYYQQKLSRRAMCNAKA
jgi:hypothetical protein